MIIKPSQKILRQKCKAIARAFLLQLHREKTRSFPSTRWYSDATGCEPLALSETINRGTEVILHRIRLGYHCAWQIIETIDYVDRCCMHLQSCEYTISETGTPPQQLPGW